MMADRRAVKHAGMRTTRPHAPAMVQLLLNRAAGVPAAVAKVWAVTGRTATHSRGSRVPPPRYHTYMTRQSSR